MIKLITKVKKLRILRALKAPNYMIFRPFKVRIRVLVEGSPPRRNVTAHDDSMHHLSTCSIDYQNGRDTSESNRCQHRDANDAMQTVKYHHYQYTKRA